MSVCDSWASFKFFQIILCLSCLLYKRWSDAEATRLFYFFEKTSREWPLLNNITRNGAGSLFADVTFGGYIIICVALYIAYLMGELKNSRKTESFLLVIGATLFIAVGCLVMTTVDSVPRDLVVNALVLGTLSVVTGMLFVLDTCLSGRRDDGGKKSRSPKSSRYGDVARDRPAVVDVVDAARADVVHAIKSHVNGAHANGKTTHSNGTHANGVHANGTHANGVHANGVHANGKSQTRSNGAHADGKSTHANGGTHANGALHANGVHVNGVPHANGGGILKRETADKRQNGGLLQTTAAGRGGGRAVETKSEGVQTTAADESDAERDSAPASPVHQYGRKRTENRGFGAGQRHGHRHADWYDTEMDLPKMKKLEINVPAEEDSSPPPDYRRRFVNVKNGVKLQSPSITSTVHNQQESPKEENEHEVKNSRVPYVSTEKKRPTRPTDLPLKSPVERVNDSLQKSVKSRFYFGANMEEPKSPNDPGYVLHTASRWEEQPIALPQNGYKNFKRSQV